MGAFFNFIILMVLAAFLSYQLNYLARSCICNYVGVFMKGGIKVFSNRGYNPSNSTSSINQMCKSRYRFDVSEVIFQNKR